MEALPTDLDNGETLVNISSRLEKQYKKLRVEYHPDKKVNAPEGQEHWTNKFQELTKGYEILKDPMQVSL